MVVWGERDLPALQTRRHQRAAAPWLHIVSPPWSRERRGRYTLELSPPRGNHLYKWTAPNLMRDVCTYCQYAIDLIKP